MKPASESESVAPQTSVSAEPSDLAQIDDAVRTLKANKDRWIATPIDERVRLLKACMDSLRDCQEEWIGVCCEIRGVERGTTAEGEQWMAGVVPVMRNLRLLVLALEAGGAPPLAGQRQRADGQWVARVFPAVAMDKVLVGGCTIDVWIEPGEAPTQGRIYRDKAEGGSSSAPAGKVALVLGAGNQSSIGPMDVLYKLFVEDEVVILKMNPANQAEGPVVAKALAPLADAGYLRIVYGKADVGAHLCAHPDVDTLHITGSDKTYDAIVWGTHDDPAEQARRKAAGLSERVNTKPFTSELGCITPWIVVPGKWSEADLEFQARQIAASLTGYAGFSCNAGQVVVLAADWAQREDFLKHLQGVLARHPSKKAWYPGAKDRHQGFLDAYPRRAKLLGRGGPGCIPWTLITDVAPTKDEYALSNEAFCGVVAAVALPGHCEADTFLPAATNFANEQLWGTLSANVLIHPDTEEQHSVPFDRAIAGLRYGGIAINCWSGANYGLVNPTWGAFPGHPAQDIQSGTGVVHNALLLDHPQKSVVRCPWRIAPTPAWFPDHKNLVALGRRVADMEHSPSWLKVPGTAWQALQG